VQNSFHIKPSEELIEYVQKFGRDAYLDFDFQLETNYGFIHKLENGKIVFFPNNFKHDGILFDDKKCFETIIKNDKFPIENPERDMFELEIERIRTFHLQADHYKNHLNHVLKFEFDKITREAAQAYLKKVIGRSIKKLTTATDIIALISVIGELIKKETNGKWFLIKRYGLYNPFFQPNLRTASGNVYLISDHVIGSVNWKTSILEHFFIDVHSQISPKIKWSSFSKRRADLIMLE